MPAKKVYWQRWTVSVGDRSGAVLLQFQGKICWAVLFICVGRFGESLQDTGVSRLMRLQPDPKADFQEKLHIC